MWNCFKGWQRRQTKRDAKWTSLRNRQSEFPQTQKGPHLNGADPFHFRNDCVPGNPSQILPDHSLVASKTVCRQSEQGDDVTAEHCERLVSKAGNPHRIGPAKIGSRGGRTIGSGNKPTSGDLEIAVDSLLQDLLFETGAGLAAQGHLQIQQANSSSRGRFIESAGTSALEFRAVQPNRLVCHPRNLDTAG